MASRGFCRCRDGGPRAWRHLLATDRRVGAGKRSSRPLALWAGSSCARTDRCAELGQGRSRWREVGRVLTSHSKSAGCRRCGRNRTPERRPTRRASAHGLCHGQKDTGSGNGGSEVRDTGWHGASVLILVKETHVQETHPSTSPLFLPLARYSGFSSTPAKTPFLP